MTSAAVSKRANRDRRGRWLPGHRQAGPGNPNLQALAAHRQAIAGAVTSEQLAAIMQALVEQALKGSVPAAQAVLERVVGRPRSPIPGALRATSATEMGKQLLAAAARGEIDAPDALALLRGVLDVADFEEVEHLEQRLAKLEARP